MPSDVFSESVLKLSFYPKLEVFDRESLWQGVDFVHDDQDPVFVIVYKLVYFFDLAALEVGDIDDVYYYRSTINLSEDLFHYLRSVKRCNAICKLNGMACLRRCWDRKVQQFILILELVAPRAYQTFIWFPFNHLLGLLHF